CATRVLWGGGAADICEARTRNAAGGRGARHSAASALHSGECFWGCVCAFARGEQADGYASGGVVRAGGTGGDCPGAHGTLPGSIAQSYLASWHILAGPPPLAGDAYRV